MAAPSSRGPPILALRAACTPASLDRKAVPKRLQRMLLWFVVLYGVVLLIAGRHIPRLYELYIRGIPTTGIVTRRGADFGLNYLFVVRGQRYYGFAKIGVAAIPISDTADPIYLTYLPQDPSVNVAGDVKDLLR